MRVVALFAVCILILAGVFEGVNGARVAGQGELGVCSRVLSAQWPSGEIFGLNPASSDRFPLSHVDIPTHLVLALNS